MSTYRIVLEVDEGWLKVLQQTTAEIYDGEVLKWLEIEEIN